MLAWAKCRSRVHHRDGPCDGHATTALPRWRGRPLVSGDGRDRRSGPRKRAPPEAYRSKRPSARRPGPIPGSASEVRRCAPRQSVVNGVSTMTATSEGIQITSTATPKAKPAADPRLGFGTVFTDHMFTMAYQEGEGWHDPRIVPYGPLSLDPAASAVIMDCTRPEMRDQRRVGQARQRRAMAHQKRIRQ